MSESLLSRWKTTAVAKPDACALIDAATGRVWTRSDLAKQVDQWVEERVIREDVSRRRVVLSERNGADWLVVFLGLLSRGAVVVLVDAQEPDERLLAVGRAVGAVGCWREGGWRPLDGSPRRRDSAQICLMKVTSGSTGLPVALPFSHAQMIADGVQVCASMGIQETDLNLSVIPFGHSYGLGNLVVPLLCQGTPVLVPSSPLPHGLAAECRRWRPTVFPAVPTLLSALVRTDTDVGDWESLRLVVSAGAVLAPELAQAFLARFGRRVHGFYGTSETGGVCFDRTGEATLTGSGVGVALAGVSIEPRRGGRFAVCSAAVGGRGVFSPPDLGRYDAVTGLKLLGRSGRVVKVAAKRVDLAEVERALRSVPGVRDAYAMLNPKRADTLVAAVLGEVDSPTVRTHLRSTLAPWKIPTRIAIWSEFPLTARGKNDTRQLEIQLARACSGAV